MHAGGASIRKIARETGIARDMVATCAARDDCSLTAPARQAHFSSGMEPFAGIVAGWLEGDEDRPSRQRHTARRIFDRLVDECGYDGSVSAVERFVRRWRRSCPAGRGEGFLELEWPAGVCRNGFRTRSRCPRRRMQGPASAGRVVAGLQRPVLRGLPVPPFREFLCGGLTAVFEHVGRVCRSRGFWQARPGPDVASPARVPRIGTVRRVRCPLRDGVRLAQPRPRAMRKGPAGERGRLRPPQPRRLRLPRAATLDEPGAWLLARCGMLLEGEHYRTAEKIAGMFTAGPAATAPPCPRPRFDAVKWEVRRADRNGRVSIESTRHLAGPAWHGRRLPVGLRASSVEIRDEHARPDHHPGPLMAARGRP